MPGGGNKHLGVEDGIGEAGTVEGKKEPLLDARQKRGPETMGVIANDGKVWEDRFN